MTKQELIGLISLVLQELHTHAATVSANLDWAKAVLHEDEDGQLKEAIAGAFRQQASVDQCHAKVLETLEDFLPDEW